MFWRNLDALQQFLLLPCGATWLQNCLSCWGSRKMLRGASWITSFQVSSPSFFSGSNRKVYLFFCSWIELSQMNIWAVLFLTSMRDGYRIFLFLLSITHTSFATYDSVTNRRTALGFSIWSRSEFSISLCPRLITRPCFSTSSFLHVSLKFT